MTVQPLQAWVPSDTFATRLVLIRRELGYSVKDAATNCGLHYATWSTWENGRKPADMVAVVSAISDALGVDRDWLMWGKAKTAPTDGGGGSVVRHQGLEPRTRWYGANRSDLQEHYTGLEFVHDNAA